MIELRFHFQLEFWHRAGARPSYCHFITIAQMNIMVFENRNAVSGEYILKFNGNHGMNQFPKLHFYMWKNKAVKYKWISDYTRDSHSWEIQWRV